MTAYRHLIVEEAPSASNGHRALFEVPADRRFSALIGSEWRSTVYVVNSLSAWPGAAKGGKGSAFPMREARASADMLLRCGPRVDGFVLLAGKRVANAFGLGSCAYFEDRVVPQNPFASAAYGGDDTYKVVVVPYPSAVSHWRNSQDNADLAAAWFREAVRDG